MSLDDVDLWNLLLDAEDEALFLAREARKQD
jgi:hypothetical protein